MASPNDQQSTTLTDLAPRADPYKQHPFRVTVYSCQERRPIRTVYLLGNVPKNVLAAARRGKPTARLDDPNNPNRWPNTTWKADDAEVLKRHYGSDWRKLLIPELSLVRDESNPTTVGSDSTRATTGGGEDFDFGNLGSLNFLDEEGTIIIEESQLGSGVSSTNRPTAASSAIDNDIGNSNPATIYSSYGVHPRDSLADLGEKVYLATGISPARQHLFWAADGQIKTTYRFLTADIPHGIDIRQFGQSEGIHIAELPVDGSLAAVVERGEAFVEALDNFRLVGDAVRGEALYHAYVCDFDELVSPRRRELSTIVGDRLQADLLYRGLVFKYWPKFSLDAMVLYLSGGDLAELYPALVPHPQTLEERHKIQGSILSRNRSQQEAIYRRYATKRSLGVTSATVQVEPHSAGRAGFGDFMRINIRNVFDLFATSTDWPAAVARFYLSSTGQGGGSRQDAVVAKTHISAALGGNDDSLTIQRAVGRAIIKHSIMIVVRSESASRSATIPRPKTSCADPSESQGLVDGAWLKGRARLVYFTLRDDGAYTLESSWPEDQRLAPAEVVKVLSKIVRPLVESINQMGILAFPTGGELYLPAVGEGVSTNFRVRGITASAFWPRALTEGAFRALKSRWREYESAGMVHVKGLQQAGAFAFQVTKGIVDYDPRAIERTIIVSTISGPGGRPQTIREFAERTQNTYTHLVDPVIAQRWGCIYPGRTVRFHHRTSDIKIELINVSDRELNWLWGLIFSFLDGLTSGPEKVAGIQLPNQARNDPSSALRASRGRAGGLRALQDRDPDLYDVRKYDSNATVYSVLCQSPRPPILHSPEEAKQLTTQRQKRLVKYWNFTESRPAFYECANSKFPHLSFLEGRHPKGYGLPCCQKTVAHPGSRRERINQEFLKMFSDGPGPDQDDSQADLLDGSSRHILSYGKRIAPGRLAGLAKFFDEELFFQTLPDDWTYRLWGVLQTLPALPRSGFYHAAAEVVGEEPGAMARKFAWAIDNMGASYAALARGRIGALFPTPHKLIDELIATFDPGDDAALFTTFSPGGVAHTVWEELVEDLIRICYGVYLVTIADANGSTSDVSAFARPSVIERLRIHDEDTLGVIFRIGHPEGKRGAGGIYPLVVQGPASTAGGPKQIISLFGASPESPTVGLTMVLREVLLAHDQPAHSSQEQTSWDLHALANILGRKEFAGYRIIRKLIGRRDLCYGVICSTTRAFYVPIAMSPHAHDDALAPFSADIKAHYGPRSTLPEALRGGRPQDVRAFLDLLAKTPLGKTNLVVDGNLITGAAAGKTTAYVGVVVTFGATTLNYYYDSSPQALYARLPKADLPVPPGEIDDALWAFDPAIEIAASPGTLRAVYLSSLYRLFLSEFSSWIYRNRNDKIRKILIEIVVASGKTTSNREADRALNEKLRKVVAGAVNNDVDSLEGDLRKLRSIISCLRTRRGANMDGFACMLNNTSFDFDLQLLHTIRRATPAQATDDVKKIMDGRVEFLSLDQIVADGYAESLLKSGVYTSCYDWPQAKCGLPSPCLVRPDGKKYLAVPPERYEGLVALLVAEVQNPLQWDAFIFQTSGVIDDLDFVRRPGERIEVRF
jgi:hypothetical protein